MDLLCGQDVKTRLAGPRRLRPLCRIEANVVVAAGRLRGAGAVHTRRDVRTPTQCKPADAGQLQLALVGVARAGHCRTGGNGAAGRHAGACGSLCGVGEQGDGDGCAVELGFPSVGEKGGGDGEDEAWDVGVD